MSYRLVAHKTLTERTHFWKDQNKQHTEILYRIEGPGISRPATDIEIAICRATIDAAIQTVKPFEKFVNVTEIGGTPEAALRKEFGVE